MKDRGGTVEGRKKNGQKNKQKLMDKERRREKAIYRDTDKRVSENEIANLGRERARENERERERERLGVGGGGGEDYETAWYLNVIVFLAQKLSNQTPSTPWRQRRRIKNRCNRSHIGI